MNLKQKKDKLMRNLILAITILAVSSLLITAVLNVDSILLFLNQDVYVNGQGVFGKIKLWHSLLAMSTPFIGLFLAVVVGYIKYRRDQCGSGSGLIM